MGLEILARQHIALIYLVYKTQNGSRNVRMLASKSMCGPSERINYPFSTITEFVVKALQLKLKLTGRKLWLDSKTAFCWIRNKRRMTTQSLMRYLS